MPAARLLVRAGLLLLAALLLAPSTQAAVTTTPSPAAVTAASNDQDTPSPCVCAVELPPVILCSDYQTQENAAKLRVIQQQFVKLTLDVSQLQAESAGLQALASSFRAKLAEVTGTFEQIEGGRVLVTRSLLEELRGGIQRLEADMKEWEEYGTAIRGGVQIRNAIQELSNVNQTLALMEAQGTSENVPAVQERIARLSSQLESCRAGHQSPTTPAAPMSVGPTATVTANVATTAATPTETAADPDTLPERWPATKRKQNSCGRLVRIMEPYTVRDDLGAGTWMRDPIKQTDAVYFQTFLSDGQGRLSVSESVKAFQEGETSAVSLATVTYLKDSVMYNGSMYAFSGQERRQHYSYSSSRQPTLHKIDRSRLSASSGGPQPTDSSSSIDVRRVLTASEQQFNTVAYQAASVVPKLDLAVDETGVWLLYGDAAGGLSAAKLDPATLEVSRSWQGSFPKSRLGNCFVICGRVHCLDGSSGFRASVSYYLDTATRTEGFARVPLMLKYGSLSSLEYNPADQLLYGLDDGHAVAYELVFQD